MSQIIRSPSLAEEKRKLPTRRQRDSQEAPISQPTDDGAPTSDPPQQSAMQELVEKARQSVMEQFRTEAESARELGRQRGLQEGRLAGREEMRQTFTDELARVRSIADRLDEALKSGIQGMEDIMVEVAFEAVCKILGTTAVTPEGIQAEVRQAITQAGNHEKLTVRLHPADLSALRDTGVLNDASETIQHVKWTGDSLIELGGCILEADGGSLDARLETQISQLRATLLEARNASDVPPV